MVGKIREDGEAVKPGRGVAPATDATEAAPAQGKRARGPSRTVSDDTVGRSKPGRKPGKTNTAKTGPAKTSAAKTGAATTRLARKRPAAAKVPYGAEEIAEIFRRFSVQRPEPKAELEHSNPFTLLVAVVLSAQATDAGVNKATRGLFAAADTAAAMVSLGEETIREHIRTIGLYRNKAKNVLKLSEVLVERHGGQVPNDRESLEALPGVGRKTANVVLNVAFGEETLAVDTHIFRIGNRLKLAPGKTPDEVEARLLPLVPALYRRHAHHWLILHGRYVCKARRPDCGACVIADLCRADEKTTDVPAALRELPERVPA